LVPRPLTGNEPHPTTHDAEEQAALVFARKVVQDRGAVADADLERLRRASYTDGMDRDNETWLAHLSGTGPDQQAALSDLRDALLRGLRRALSHRASAGDEFLEDIVQDALVRILERLERAASPALEGRLA
jgi:hypothetical protein